jgi:hypothetical protein
MSVLRVNSGTGNEKVRAGPILKTWLNCSSFSRQAAPPRGSVAECGLFTYTRVRALGYLKSFGAHPFCPNETWCERWSACRRPGPD